MSAWFQDFLREKRLKKGEEKPSEPFVKPKPTESSGVLGGIKQKPVGSDAEQASVAPEQQKPVEDLRKYDIDRPWTQARKPEKKEKEGTDKSSSEIKGEVKEGAEKTVSAIDEMSNRVVGSFERFGRKLDNVLHKPREKAPENTDTSWGRAAKQNTLAAKEEKKRALGNSAQNNMGLLGLLMGGGGLLYDGLKKLFGGDKAPSAADTSKGAESAAEAAAKVKATVKPASAVVEAAEKEAPSVLGRVWNGTKYVGSKLGQGAKYAAEGIGENFIGEAGVRAVEDAGSSAWQGTKNLAKKAVSTKFGSSVADTFESGVSTVKNGLSSVADTGSAALTGIKSSGSGLLDSLGLNSISGLAKNLGRAAVLGDAGYDLYSNLSDDKKSDYDKAKGVTQTGGRLAGVLAGAQAGAALGTATGGGFGAVVGGIGGGLVGGFAGEEAVNQVVNPALDTFNEKVVNSKLGDAIGLSVSAVLSPFNKDARNNLENAYRDSIAPRMADANKGLETALGGLTSMFASFSDVFKDSIHKLDKTLDETTEGIKSGATGIWSGIKAGVQQVSSGYDKGGVSGALGSIPSAVTAGKQAASAGMDAASQHFGKAAEAFTGIGSVSSKFESGSGTVAQKAGMVGDSKYNPSYGSYQIESKKGTMDQYLKGLDKSNPEMAATLRAAGPAGSDSFTAAWKGLANDPNKSQAFADSQHDFIKQQKYDPAAAKASALGFKTDDPKVQEAIWSASVQHGGVQKILASTASANPDFANMSPEDQTKALYKSRGDYSYNAQVKDGRSDKEARAGSYDRYDKELKSVLALKQPDNTKVASKDSIKLAQADTSDSRGLDFAFKDKGPYESKPAVVGAVQPGSRLYQAPADTPRTTSIGQVDGDFQFNKASVGAVQPGSRLYQAPADTRGLQDAFKDKGPYESKRASVDAVDKSSRLYTPRTTVASVLPDSNVQQAGPVATGKAAPVTTVAENTPREVTNVALADTGQGQDGGGSQYQAPQQAGGTSSGRPVLSDVPIHISDMGLVLLNIGHL